MQKLFKETAVYVVLNYVSLFLTTIRGILLINILTPFSLGIYKLFFTYSSYFRYYNLGFNALAFYRAPVRGLQDTYAFLLRKINIALAWSFGALFTVVFAIIWWDTLREIESIDFILWLFAILYFTQLAETFITISKIRKNFPLINRYNLIFAFSSTALMIGLGYLWELRGVIAGLCFSTIIASLYAAFALRERVSLAITLSRFKLRTLFRHSIITILPGMFIVLFSTVEVWIITWFFGAEETGFYSVVITFVNIILMLNTDGIVFLYSKRSGNFRKDPAFVLKITMIAFALVAGVCVVGLFVVDWGIQTFFPRYLRATEIYKICFWGIPFLVARNVVVSFISINRTVFIGLVLFGLLIMKTVVLLFFRDLHDFYIALAAANVLFGIILIFVFIFSGAFGPGANAVNSNRNHDEGTV